MSSRKAVLLRPRALGVPKSTLSRRIARLEEQLGVRLVHRSTRKLTLTDIGREFLAHCETVVAAANSARGSIERVQQIPRGTVRLTAPMDISRALLAPALPEFMAEYPDVTVKLEAINRRVDLLEEGVDVAIRVRPSIEDSSLVMRPVATSAALLVAAPALIERLGEPADPRGLNNLPTLSMAFADGRHRLNFQGQNGEMVTVHHEPRLTTDDMSVLKEAAIAGIGIVTLPGFMCYPALREGALKILLPQWQLPAGQIHIVYPHRRGLLPAVRVLIDFLARRLPDFAEQAGVSSRSTA